MQHGIEQLSRAAYKRLALRSSSAPGASPTMSQSACGLPTPNTVCVRVALKVHRVQAATRARNSGQSDSSLARRRRGRVAAGAPQAQQRSTATGTTDSAALSATTGTTLPRNVHVVQPQRGKIFSAQLAIHACDGAARFLRRSLRNTQIEGADKAYRPKTTSKLIGRCRKMKMNASGTSTM